MLFIAVSDWYARHARAQNLPDGVPQTCGYTTIRNDPGRDRDVVVVAEDLEQHECDEQDGKDNKERNDLAAVPLILGSTPLQSQEQADYATEEEQRAQWVELQDLLLDRLSRRSHGTVNLQDEQNDNGSNGTDGQVDVEAANVKFDTFGRLYVSTYHHRHVAYVVKTPPSSGPTTLATPKTAPAHDC